MPHEARPGLELEEDLAFQRKSWRAERVSWGLLGLTLLVALTGLLGHGPLSAGTGGTRGSDFWVEYQRFPRYQTSEALRFHVGPAAAGGRPIQLWIGAGYLRDTEIVSIVPQPERAIPGTERITFAFAAPPAGQGAEITFELRADAYGPRTARVGLADGPAFDLGLFVYP